MSDELPTIAAKDDVCHIDFEFVIPYHSPLTSKELLQECIALSINDVLSNANGQISTLDMDNIDIPEIDLKPNSSKPQRIKVGGWITCKDQQRQTYMDALQLAQQSKKLSKKICDKTGIKKTKVSINQFTTKFSNAHHVNRSFIDATEKQFKEFQKSHSVLSNHDNNNNNDDEQKQQQQPNDIDDTPQLISSNEAASSVIIHHHIDDNKVDHDNNNNNNNNNNDDEEEEYDMLSKQSTNDNDNDSSFQMIDAQYDGDDQSSNEEQKSGSNKNLHVNVENDNGDIVDDDYTSITPRMPGLSPVSPLKADDGELKILKKEIKLLKQQHAEERDHFQNKINVLKQQDDLQRQRSRISMQIDEDIINKQIKQQTHNKVMELESEIIAKQKEQSVSIRQLQLQHQTELQKFDYKLRQTQQLHSLEMNNIQSQHKFETEQLQSQIRALTGSLERESQKDRKIHELTEENEQLKADKERTISNYDVVIEKLNNESEESIRQEIDKRIKETAQLKREIHDLQQAMRRLNDKNDLLQIEIKQLQNENQQKDHVINQMKTMFVNEKKKNGMLERKLVKSKRNIHHNNNHNHRDDKRHEKETKILEKGGHIRKKSKTLKNRTVTMSKLDTGVAVIEIEKNNQPLNILADITDFDAAMDTDSDYDDDLENHNKDKRMMAEDEHNQEIALKDSQIEQLKEKISNLEANISKLKQQTAEELQASQQKIGSLQQKIEIEQENFMKQNQMLEFKLKKKENDSKKSEESLHDLRRAHRKEIRMLNEEIDKLTNEHLEKDRAILSLEQHLDMVQEENVRLKQYEQDIADYEQEIEDIDEHYQNMLEEIRRTNEETQEQLNDFLHTKEEENKNLQSAVHQHTDTIAQLQSMLNNMKFTEDVMKDKEQQIQDIMAKSKQDLTATATATATQQTSRESREIDENEIDLININLSDHDDDHDDDDDDDDDDDNQQSLQQKRRPSKPIGPVPDDHDSSNMDKTDNNIDDDDDHDDDDDDDHDDDNNIWQEPQGQNQASQPVPEPDSPSLGMGRQSIISNIDDYILKDEMDDIIQTKLDELNESMKMQHALSIDTVESKYKQKYENMENQLKGNIDRLNNNNNQLTNKLNETQNKLQQTEKNMKRRLESAEIDRVKLLQSFMTEMDRMREEIKKLNTMRRNNQRR